MMSMGSIRSTTTDLAFSPGAAAPGLAFADSPPLPPPENLSPSGCQIRLPNLARHATLMP